jgi:hypothetical protein
MRKPCTIVSDCGAAIFLACEGLAVSTPGRLLAEEIFSVAFEIDSQLGKCPDSQLLAPPPKKKKKHSAKRKEGELTEDYLNHSASCKSKL